MHATHYDENGVLRFVRNNIISDLIENSMSLNEIGILTEQGEYTLHEYLQLLQLLGYSLEDFYEVAEALRKDFPEMNEDNFA